MVATVTGFSLAPNSTVMWVPFGSVRKALGPVSVANALLLPRYGTVPSFWPCTSSSGTLGGLAHVPFGNGSWVPLTEIAASIRGSRQHELKKPSVVIAPSEWPATARSDVARWPSSGSPAFVSSAITLVRAKLASASWFR